MKVDNISRQALNYGFEHTGQFVKGHINGFNFSFTPTTDDLDLAVDKLIHVLRHTVVKIKYQNNKIVNLIPNIPLVHLLEVSELRDGATGIGNLSKVNRLIQHLKTVSAEAGVSEDPAENHHNLENELSLLRTAFIEMGSVELPMLRFHVDLGSIYVNSGTELHYTLSHNPLLGELPTLPLYMDVSVDAVSVDLDAFSMYQYDIDADKNELHSQIIKSYLISNEDIADFEIDVDSTSDQFSTDKTGLVTQTNLFNRVEGISVFRTLPCYNSLEGIPEDVHVKILPKAGSDVAGLRVMNVRVLTDLKEYVKGEQEKDSKVNEVLLKASQDPRSQDVLTVLATEQQK